jgi:hypothetical protein
MLRATLVIDVQLRKSDAAFAPSVIHQHLRGIAPRYDSATGFPVRSHHLSGLRERTAVKGELLHHCFHYNPPPTVVSMRAAPQQHGSRRPGPMEETLLALVLLRRLVATGVV